jgi:hypothetical protein
MDIYELQEVGAIIWSFTDASSTFVSSFCFCFIRVYYRDGNEDTAFLERQPVE